jgi:hypothetical protein
VDGTVLLGLAGAVLVFVMASAMLRSRPVRRHGGRGWDRYSLGQKLLMGMGAVIAFAAVLRYCTGP